MKKLIGSLALWWKSMWGWTTGKLKAAWTGICAGISWLKSMKGQPWDWKQRWAVIWRLSLTGMTMFALLWGIWSMTGNPVPAVSVPPGFSISLPLSVSRWLDVPLSAAWCAMMVVAFTVDWKRKATIRAAAVICLAVGLAFGLFVGLYAIAFAVIIIFMKWVLIDKKALKKIFKFFKK